MTKSKFIFFIVTISLAVMIFVQSCISDTRVNDSLGILATFEDIANDKGSSINYDGYNEALAVAWLKAVYNKNATELTEDEITKEFDNIFENKDGSFVTKQMSAIMENSNIPMATRNIFDHNFYGEISTLAVVKSKGFYISQNNKKYYEIAYSGSNMNVHGCGPISLTMALNMLSGQSKYDAETLALWAKNNGYMDPTSGTVWAFIDEYAKEQDFNVEQTALTAEDLSREFSQGAVVITCMGKGAFTEEGHFIVLSGMDSQGDIRVVDPVSIYRTNKNWPAQQILKESKGTFWVLKR